MAFYSFNLQPDLVDSIIEQKYESPFPIQEKIIPLVLEKKDILAVAPTGSGKTASYVLPIISSIMNLPKNESRAVDILILVPTRELSIQVGDVFNNFLRGIPQKIRCISVYGGVSINPQMKSLFGTNILVATPGRLIELLEKNALSLFSVQTLVLDEADKLLNKDFKEEMTFLETQLPQKRQNLFFSATFSKKIEKFAATILKNPIVIKIKEEVEDISQIEQVAYQIPLEGKGPLLRKILKEYEDKSVLIFASSIRKVNNLVSKLEKNKIKATAIHSKLSQGQRKEVIENFRSKRIKVLVATDLLARGIDFDKLDLVINYELPRSPLDYVHRVGRTGRAKHTGKAISLITPDDQAHFRVIQKKMGQWVDMIDGQSILEEID